MAGRWLEDSPLCQVIFQPLSYSPSTCYAISGRYGRFFHVQVIYNANHRRFVAEVSGLRSKQWYLSKKGFYLVLRRPETSATDVFHAAMPNWNMIAWLVQRRPPLRMFYTQQCKLKRDCLVGAAETAAPPAGCHTHLRAQKRSPKSFDSEDLK